ADSNQDGSGDACQPAVTLFGIQHAGGSLEVSMTATDPQNDPLRGSLDILSNDTSTLVLPDVLASADCGQGFLPSGARGQGVGFTNAAAGAPYLFDLDTILGCGDLVPDYILALGRCDHPQ